MKMCLSKAFVFSFLTIVLFAGVATGAIVSGVEEYKKITKQELERLKKADEAKNNGDFQECENLLIDFPIRSKYFSSSQALLNQCKLEFSKDLAQEEKCQAADAKIKEITPDSLPLEDAQQLIYDCSGSVLKNAIQLVLKEKYEEAIKELKKIPLSVRKIHKNAQTLIKSLEELLNAKSSLAKEKYNTAITKAIEIPDGLDPEEFGEVISHIWSELAEWSHVPLDQSLDLSLDSKVERSRETKEITTKLGSSKINKQPEYFFAFPISDEYKKVNPAWKDPWRESYEIVPGKMTLAFTYGCREKYILQTEAVLSKDISLEFMRVKLEQMLGKNKPTDAMEQTLKEIYDGKDKSGTFENYGVLIEPYEYDGNQIRIAVINQ